MLHYKREMLNVISYVVRTGCQWRYLPRDFPNWKTVYEQFRRWEKEKIFESINMHILKDIRRNSGKSDPTTAIVDSQSVKTTEKGGLKGMTGLKKLKVRKRHIITDTNGLVLGCYVGPANENDREGLRVSLYLEPKLNTQQYKKIWADMGYMSQALGQYTRETHDTELCIVKRPPSRFWVPQDKVEEFLQRTSIPTGFKVQPKRWIVERTFAWINRNRRLSKEYDLLP